MEEDKKKKVVSLIQEAAKPARKPRTRKPEKPSNVFNIKEVGNANQFAGGDIHNHFHATPPRPRIEVVPGEGVITEEQKVELTRLRDAWITLHGEIKRKPLGFASAWSRINKAAGATSYHLIKPENFPAAVAYVHNQMAMLRNMPSAPAKDKAWRASRIRSIKARCARELGNPEFYKAYLKKNFGLDSLADLATDQLQRTYTYIMGKKAP